MADSATVYAAADRQAVNTANLLYNEVINNNKT